MDFVLKHTAVVYLPEPDRSTRCHVVLYTTFRVKGGKCIWGYYNEAIAEQETVMVNSEVAPTILNLVWGDYEKLNVSLYHRQT